MKWTKIYDDDKLRIFASSDSFVFHYKNENDRWRKGNFGNFEHVQPAFVQLIENMHNRSIVLRDRCETSEQKREAIEELFTLWNEWPRLRLGQLIGNVYGNDSFYYVEDKPFIQTLQNFYNDPTLLNT